MSIDLVQIKCLPLSYNFSFLRNYSGFQASQFLSRKFLREKFKLTGIFSLAAGDASLIDAKSASFQFPKLLKQKTSFSFFRRHFASVARFHQFNRSRGAFRFASPLSKHVSKKQPWSKFAEGASSICKGNSLNTIALSLFFESKLLSYYLSSNGRIQWK